jgi:hypothetical protein
LGGKERVTKGRFKSYRALTRIPAQLRKFGIQKEKSPPRVVPFGWSWKNERIVKNAKEQAVIREILRLHACGKSLKEIAAELNRRKIPTKDKGSWWHSTVGRVLRRATNNECS